MRTSSAVLLATVLAAPQLSRAAVIEPLSFERLVEVADRIVVGTVGEARVRASDDGRILVTDTTLDVESTLKGAPASRVVVRSSGGVLGDRGQAVPGTARFVEGERVLLFLETRGEQGGLPRCRVVAMSYGKYHLSPGAHGDVIAVRDLDGLAARGPAGAQVAPLLPETPQDAAVLLDRIRALLARSGPPAMP